MEDKKNSPLLYRLLPDSLFSLEGVLSATLLSTKCLQASPGVRGLDTVPGFLVEEQGPELSYTPQLQHRLSPHLPEEVQW